MVSPCRKCKRCIFRDTARAVSSLANTANAWFTASSADLNWPVRRESSASGVYFVNFDEHSTRKALPGLCEFVDNDRIVASLCCSSHRLSIPLSALLKERGRVATVT